MIPNFDMSKILTAVAPIVTSVATTMANKNKPVEVIENTIQPKPPTYNITINNIFVVTSEEDAVMVANKIKSQISNSVSQLPATNYRV